MATLSKGKTFTNGELVTPEKIHQLVDSATVANITNADLAANAAIADTKLAQISTAGKVLPTAVQGTAVITTDSRLSDARTPTTHTHDDRYYTETEVNSLLAGKQAAGSYAAATHTHAISDTTGLQMALDGKAASSHTHTIANVTGLQTALDGKQASGSYAPATGIAQSAVTNLTTDLAGKAASSHTHTIANVTGLQTALDGKQASGSYAPATGIAPSAITGTAVITTDSRLSDARTPTTHTHDASNITSGTLSNARTTATSENSANAIVARNGNGDFSAQTINSSVVNTSTLNVTNPSGNAAIEVGGNGYAFIDLKVPNSDDNDLRIGTTGNGGYLETSNNGNIILNPGTGSVGIAIGTPEARLHVVRGANIWGSAQFAGSQETSFFHNGADEHTYIRGGRSASHVYINDVNPDGYTFIGSGGLGIHTAPSHGRKLQINGRVGFQNLPTFANNSTAISGGLTIDDVYKTATGELRVVV
jgi:hypothetical protein